MLRSHFQSSQHPLLLVEPDRHLRASLRTTLVHEGFPVREASLGYALPELLLAEEQPSLVILERDLPDTNAIEVCRVLRENPPTSGLPIIVLSSRTDEKDRIAALEAGADDYVVRPVSPRELFLRVRALLTHRLILRLVG